MYRAPESSKFLALAAIFAASILTTGCASQGKAAGSEADANMQAFNQYVEGWKQRNPQAIVESMTPSGTYSAPGVGENLNHQNFIGYAKDLFQAVPDFTIRQAEPYVFDGDAMGEKWVVSGTWTGPWTTGPLAGMEPTGKSFVLPGAALIDFKDGKISSVVQYYDNLSLMTQIGAIPSK